MSEIPDQLGDYLTARDRQRAERAAGKFAALSEREQRLVREAAVLGFVQGAMANAAGRAKVPGDRDILLRVLDAADAFDDLYPLLAGLGNPTT